MLKFLKRYRKKSDDMSLLKDWRQALQTPHVYRVGNSSVRIQNQCLIGLIILFIPIILYTYPSLVNTVCSSKSIDLNYYKYNSTYPLTSPIKTDYDITFKIAIISDLDTDSKQNDKELWISRMMVGALHWNYKKKFSISFNEPMTLSSNIAMKGRGMELSELVIFDGKVLSFDDRTGLVFYIEGTKIYPWIILMDGDGKSIKGFKSEWATVKDNHLYVGSMGKEWTTPAGIFSTNNPMWVKIISPRGDVRHVDWMENYKKLRRSLSIEFPGYMIHESAMWSDIRNRWIFLPRRCSEERYNETKDEEMACNVLLIADEDFSNIEVKRIDNVVPIRGFSSFKFIPGTDDSIIVALKSEEFKGRTATYITVFTIDGDILLPDEKIADIKYEGLEFV